MLGKANSLEKTLMLGKTEGRGKKRVTEDEMVGWHSQLNDMSLSKLWEMVKVREAWHALIYGGTKSRIQFSD